VVVGGFLDEPEHDRAEQDDGGEFHVVILLARRTGAIGIGRNSPLKGPWNR
jgi:hypothetical protein